MSGNAFATLLEAEALGLQRVRRTILDIDALRLEAAQIVLLTGANGAGKTSLLKVLAGLHTADSGRFHGLGTPMNCEEAARYCRGRHVYLHQTPYMFDASVEQNIAYGLRVRGQPLHTRQAEVRAALAWAGLEALAARPARELSLGEQQRVALTRAYVLAPSALLLDEITANLDAAHRRHVHDMLSALRERGTCVVFATHDPAPLLSRVDHHLHIEAGRLTPPARGDAQVVPLRRDASHPAQPGRS